MTESTTPALRARPANAEDSRDLFDWRNDPLTRAASRSIEPVTWAHHEKWFSGVLADEHRELYIVEIEATSESVGMCRFDSEAGDLAEVSINLNPALRGRGLSVPVLLAAVEKFRDGGGGALTATIRPENTASIRVFEKAGFRLVSSSGDFNTYLA